MLKSQKRYWAQAKLISIIGDPLDNNSKVSMKADEDIVGLLPHAIKNKVPLLFLQRLPIDQIEEFYAYYKHYWKRRNRSVLLITETASLLEKNGINYAFFKTLKPFPDAPTDIDILVKSRGELQESYRILSSTGQTLIAKDSFTYTLYSKKHRLNIDLYLHPTVADMIYLDKDTLMNHTVQTELESSTVRTLSPEAEIVAVTSHSLYKEHMYTLNDHYTLLTLLKKAKLQKALELANETCTTTALKVSATLSYLISEHTNTTNSHLKNLIALFKNNGDAQLKLNSRQLDLPYKYNPYHLTRCFIEKIRRDNLSLSTTPLLLKRGFTKRFLTLLTARLTA